VYVCMCRAVTVAQVAASVADGARDVQAVGARTGAGTGCGGCRDHIEQVIRRECGEVRPRLAPQALAG